MDTSKEYIKMCEKAGEIQGAWEPKEGDISVWTKHALETKASTTPFFAWADEDGMLVCGDTWLPRQDQLQDMLFDETVSCAGKISFLHEECDTLFDEPENYSMEQLWLAFVMSEKFDKTWDGEDWVGEA